MADDPLVMADLVADALDLSGAEVSDLVKAVPFLNLLPMESSSNGETHKYAKETGAPVVGFRAPNLGRDFDSSVDGIVTVTLKHLDFSFRVDKAVADIWRKGGAAALIAREGLRHLQAAMVAYERQLIYGTSAQGDTDGFTGMVNATTVDALADGMVVDATGSSAGAATSVWAIRVSPNDLTGVYNGDEPFSLGDTIVQDATDATGKHYPAYYTPAGTWLGIQVGSIYSMGRIVNLTTQANKGLTDSLLADLVGAFPTGKEPTHILLNRQSRKQLKKSRTATTPTGAPAPWPVDFDGIPLVQVESIVNTESIVA